MKMKKIIVANWKENPTSLNEAGKIFEGVKNGLKSDTAEVVICPPFVYLPAMVQQNEGRFAVGAQNISYAESGAFTGEISPLMLRDLGVEYVIIGHSERRKYFGETDEAINQKIKLSLEGGLNVIFCIGETQEQRDAGQTNQILERQIKAGLDSVSNFKFQISNLSIAYEPVWAIGTGKNCSVGETKEAILFIKTMLPAGTRVLYGGSVKSGVSGEYLKEAGADGLLVGGASLDAEEFLKIINSAD